jgi:hypothetical protein
MVRNVMKWERSKSSFSSNFSNHIKYI